MLGALSERGHLRGLPLGYGLWFSCQDSWPLGPAAPKPPLPCLTSPLLPSRLPPPAPELLSCTTCLLPGPVSPVPRLQGRVAQWATVPLTPLLLPGMPTCRCPTGFTGPKCTQQVCAGYCANNSTCTVNQGNQPQCRCLPGFLGGRCQYRE